jgi:hypothetical protein
MNAAALLASQGGPDYSSLSDVGQQHHNDVNRLGQQQQQQQQLQQQQQQYQQQQQQQQNAMQQYQQQQLVQQQIQYQRAWQQRMANNVQIEKDREKARRQTPHGHVHYSMNPALRVHAWQVEDIRVYIECKNLFLPTNRDINRFHNLSPGISIWCHTPTLPALHLKTAPVHEILRSMKADETSAAAAAGKKKMSLDDPIEVYVSFVISAQDLLFHSRGESTIELTLYHELLDPVAVSARNRSRIRSAMINDGVATEANLSEEAGIDRMGTQASARYKPVGRHLLGRVAIPYYHLLQDSLTQSKISDAAERAQRERTLKELHDQEIAASLRATMKGGGGGDGGSSSSSSSSSADSNKQRRREAEGLHGNCYALRNPENDHVNHQLRKRESHACVKVSWVRAPREHPPPLPHGFVMPARFDEPSHFNWNSYFKNMWWLLTPKPRPDGDGDDDDEKDNAGGNGNQNAPMFNNPQQLAQFQQMMQWQQQQQMIQQPQQHNRGQSDGGI